MATVYYSRSGYPEETANRLMMRHGSKRLLRAMKRIPRAKTKSGKRVRHPRVWHPWEIAPAYPVIERAAVLFGIPVSDLIGRSRVPHLVDARTVVALTLRDMDWSYPRIGAALDRDHTTILNLVDRYSHRQKVPWVASATETLRREFITEGAAPC